jgi:hypothetical protein
LRQRHALGARSSGLFETARGRGYRLRFLAGE